GRGRQWPAQPLRPALPFDLLDSRLIAHAWRLDKDPVDAASLQERDADFFGRDTGWRSGGSVRDGGWCQSEHQDQAGGRQPARPLEALGGGGWTQGPKGTSAASFHALIR